MVRRAQKDPHSTVARGDHERFVVNTKSSDKKAEHGVGVVDDVPLRKMARIHRRVLQPLPQHGDESTIKATRNATNDRKTDSPMPYAETPMDGASLEQDTGSVHARRPP